MNINFTYLRQPPKKYTFEMPEVKLWTERQCKGKVLNLFAGKTKLKVDEIRVDMDENMPADFHMNAFDFINGCYMYQWGVIVPYNIFDTIILDPPYNLRKSREKYEGRWIGSLTKIKNELSKILNPDGRVITFGYDSVGMSLSRGFQKIAICLVCHGGDHNDTICTVEEYTQGSLF